MFCGFIRLSRLCLIHELKVRGVSSKIRFLFFRMKELGLSASIYIVIIIIIIIIIVISFMQGIYTYFLRQTMSIGNRV
jgi:hypothetical protein